MNKLILPPRFISEQCIPRFLELEHTYGHTRFSQKPGFRQANCELFHLAQAIAIEACPLVQAHLIAIRMEVMRYLTNEIAERDHLQASDAVMAPIRGRRDRIWIWTNIQITPEVACDPTLTGIVVPRKFVVKLNDLLKDQISEVLNYVY